MKYGYSRRQSIESKQNIRSAVIYVVLTIGAILLILFFGIPAMGKIAGFFHDLRTSGQPIDTNDSTPPAPPRFELLPEYTNKTKLDIAGKTEPGATVILTLNDKQEELVANANGDFNYDWELWKGANKISAKAKDSAGNESNQTSIYTIQFDDKPPALEIKSPANGASFGGSRQRQITIEGKTEEKSAVTINDRIVAVDLEGDFSYFTSLSDGENVFTIKSKDPAGNETQTSLTLFFTP